MGGPSCHARPYAITSMMCAITSKGCFTGFFAGLVYRDVTKVFHPGSAIWESMGENPAGIGCVTAHFPGRGMGEFQSHLLRCTGPLQPRGRVRERGSPGEMLMMRRWTTILIGVAVLAIGTAVVLHTLRAEPEWSSSSEPALAAFRQGLDAEKQLYHNEAREHFARALDLDPSFVMARFKLLLLSGNRAGRVDRLKELVAQTDLENLSARERFLILYRLAVLERDQERAGELLADYLAKAPDDLSALAIRCDRSFFQGELEAATDCYERVLQIDPDWVVAQNQLGYISMGKGDFAAAERFFKAYLATAPDQANPHDSLGELYMLTGRYAQARHEFESAVAIRPDFCASLAHLTDLSLLEGDLESASTSMERAKETVCPPEFIAAQNCRVAIWRELVHGEFSAAVEQSASPDCAEEDQGFLTRARTHRAAMMTGQLEAASQMESRLQKMVEKYPDARLARAMLAHYRAMRLVEKGRTIEAIPLLQQADSQLRYEGSAVGLLKLYNRLALANALEISGTVAEAEAIRDEVRAVNPLFLEQFSKLSRIRPAAWGT
jgi:tetratricopeptide (TPR) repeat protein